MPGIKTAIEVDDHQPIASTSKSSSAATTSFNTLDREHAFSHPSTKGPKYPAPHALVAPHIQSFDALFEGAPLPYPQTGVSASEGLLDLAVKDLMPKVVFDGRGAEGSLGNRLESSCPASLPSVSRCRADLDISKQSSWTIYL